MRFIAKRSRGPPLCSWWYGPHVYHAVGTGATDHHRDAHGQLAVCAKLIAAVHDFALKNLVPGRRKLVASYIDSSPAMRRAWDTLAWPWLQARWWRCSSPSTARLTTSGAPSVRAGCAAHGLYRVAGGRASADRREPHAHLLPLCTLRINSHVFPLLDDGIVRLVPFSLWRSAWYWRIASCPRHIADAIRFGGRFARRAAVRRRQLFVCGHHRCAFPPTAWCTARLPACPSCWCGCFFVGRSLLGGAEVAATLSYFRHPLRRESRTWREPVHLKKPFRSWIRWRKAGAPMDHRRAIQSADAHRCGRDILHALEDASLIKREARGAIDCWRARRSRKRKSCAP